MRIIQSSILLQAHARDTWLAHVDSQAWEDCSAWVKVSLQGAKIGAHSYLGAQLGAQEGVNDAQQWCGQQPVLAQQQQRVMHNGQVLLLLV